MNQQSQWSGYQQSQYPQKPPHVYSWQVLSILVIIYIGFLVLLIITPTNGSSGNANPNSESFAFQVISVIGVCLLFTLHGVIIAIDGRNFFTLNGNIRWRSLNRWVLVGLAIIYCSFFIMPAIYLIFAIKHFADDKRKIHTSSSQTTADQSADQPVYEPHRVTPTPQVQTAPSDVLSSKSSKESPIVSIPQRRTKVFISYSHKDEKHFQRLKIHFAHYERMGIVEIWDDTKVAPGALWQEEIKRAISQTKVALLLVSADYLASQFIVENELPPLLRAAQTEGATIIPVILSACAFEASELARFQAVNRPTKPLSGLSWDEKEKVWATVAKMVSSAMNSHQPLSTPKNAPPPLIERNKEFEHETARAQQLVLERPKGWEYLLTAELLYSKLLPIKQRLSDINNGSVYQRSTSMSGEYFFNWAQAKVNDLSSLVRFVGNILNGDIPASWGPPGIAGDPLAIKRAVEKLIYLCDEMLKREVEIRFIVVPSHLARLKQTMEGWSTEVIYQIDSIPASLAAPFAQPNPTGVYNIHLVFREPANLKAFHSELKRIQAKVKKYGKGFLSS